MQSAYKSVYKSDNSKTELLSIYDKILANWPMPFKELYVNSAYGRTHVIQCGNEKGRPVLFFHGTGNNSLMWRYNCEELGKQFKLFLVDTINDPGKSEASVDFNPQNNYGEWVKELLVELQIEKCCIIGHSKGGWIALNSALEIRNRVEKIVLLAPAMGINSKLSLKFLLKSISVGINPSIKNVRKYFQYISSPEKELNSGYIEYVSKILKGTISRPIPHRQFTDTELKSLMIPILLLFGDLEVCVDYKVVMERASSLFQSLESKVIPNAGHGLQGEYPEIVNKMLLEFLATRP